MRRLVGPSCNRPRWKVVVVQSGLGDQDPGSWTTQNEQRQRPWTVAPSGSNAARSGQWASKAADFVFDLRPDDPRDPWVGRRNLTKGIIPAPA